jgi:hypothetical protein
LLRKLHKTLEEARTKRKRLKKKRKKKEKTHTRINRLKFPSKELTAEEEDGNRLPDTLSLVGHHGCERWMRVWLWIYRRRRRLPPPPLAAAAHGFFSRTLAFLLLFGRFVVTSRLFFTPC